MGKALENKLKKRTALLDSAYELFTTMGFTKTTIRDIASKAGVAKGTFYLYFKDKSDIRDALIRSKASHVLQMACKSMDKLQTRQDSKMDVADKFVYIIDYIVDYLAHDVLFVKFISKHLSWGMFANGQRTSREYYGLTDEDDVSLIDFSDYIHKMLEADNVQIRDLDLLLFTLLELVSSVLYDLMLYEQPLPLKDFKPYLNHCIRLLVNDAVL